jgi:protein subunit release factor A
VYLYFTPFYIILDAKKFKDQFEECQKLLENKDVTSEAQESDKLAKELEGLNVKENKDTEKDVEKKDTTTEGTKSANTDTPDKEEKKKKEDEDVPEK